MSEPLINLDALGLTTALSANVADCFVIDHRQAKARNNFDSCVEPTNGLLDLSKLGFVDLINGADISDIDLEKYLTKREAIATNNFEGDPQYDKVIQLLKIASKSVHSAAIAAHRHFSALDKPTFHSTYQHLFGVVANTQIFERIFNLINEKRRFSSLLACQIITSFIDRALGDTLNTIEQSKEGHHAKRKHFGVPGKQREVLESSSLIEVLGKDLVMLLRVAQGVPRGVNVKNLLWHGFVKYDEFSEEYTTFCLLLLLTLSSVVLAKFPALKHRPVRNGLEDTLNRSYKDLLVPELLVPLSQELVNSISAILPSSSFIQPSRIEIWQDALQLFVEARYYEFLCLVFPQFEHSLRVIYAIENFADGAAGHILSSEFDTRHCTLVQLLAHHNPETKCPNKLLERLGPNLVRVLYDILVWDCGLCLRDKVSHGMIPDWTVPQYFANLLLCTCGYMIAINSKNPSDILSSVENHTIKAVLNYSVQYHPAQDAARSLEAAQSSLRELTAIAPSFAEVPRESPFLPEWHEKACKFLRGLCATLGRSSLMDVDDTTQGIVEIAAASLKPTVTEQELLQWRIIKRIGSKLQDITEALKSQSVELCASFSAKTISYRQKNRLKFIATNFQCWITIIETFLRLADDALRARSFTKEWNGFLQSLVENAIGGVLAEYGKEKSLWIYSSTLGIGTTTFYATSSMMTSGETKKLHGLLNRHYLLLLGARVPDLNSSLVTFIAKGDATPAGKPAWRLIDVARHFVIAQPDSIDVMIQAIPSQTFHLKPSLANRLLKHLEELFAPRRICYFILYHQGAKELGVLAHVPDESLSVLDAKEWIAEVCRTLQDEKHVLGLKSGGKVGTATGGFKISIEPSGNDYDSVVRTVLDAARTYSKEKASAAHSAPR